METNRNTDPGGAATPEQFFPDRRDDILRLRSQDQIFDEICSDFELIAGIARNEGAMDPAVAECLAGLREEIGRALTRCTRGSEI